MCQLTLKCLTSLVSSLVFHPLIQFVAKKKPLHVSLTFTCFRFSLRSCGSVVCSAAICRATHCQRFFYFYYSAPFKKLAVILAPNPPTQKKLIVSECEPFCLKRGLRAHVITLRMRPEDALCDLKFQMSQSLQQ